MSAPSPGRDLVVGTSPCGEPNARLTAAVCRGGGLGVLDLGRGDRWARQSLELTRAWVPDHFGVRVPAGCAIQPADLDRLAGGRVDTVVLGGSSPWRPVDVRDRYRVLAEVTSLDEARAAVDAGAHGLIARGSEAGGRVGDLSAFVLLQQLLADAASTLPIWAAGGIGLGTAAAAVLGGAAGVVLDAQLALLAEADLPAWVTAKIRTMDGSETELVDGHRLLRRRTPRTADDAAIMSPSDTVPVGQDGSLARVFADRFGDAASAVRAVREEVAQVIADADAARVLLPGSPLAAGLGTPLPVAQGPMTRVSDQAPFAAAVADAGGLPFIALALSGSDQARSLLAQTRDTLRGRPWGVGVLGFAPEETRAAQLAVIREIRPPYAIIAGGRPAQAKVLEDAGISTFLHVPSPGLLTQFLAAGARKFVFEGAECGGHVGPRASFPLWESQLTVLHTFLDGVDRTTAEQIQVFFAGGVHDARSAAMVAALARSVSSRGVRVGILMGTAYLFTREVVDCGAIQATFQRQVLAADRTVLLESAPGHATRAVASPFTERFEVHRARLAADGRPGREVWEELEQLNVGRLRVASKGLRRDADRLVPVDEAEQLVDGLFMAGQVAVLRSGRTTLAALHADVSTGAYEFYAERSRTVAGKPGAVTPPPPPLDIAIVGMACMFPQSPDLDSFWATVLSGADAVTEVPRERWDPDGYYSPDAVGRDAGTGTPSKWGGFLPQIPFDPLRYGIPPAALRSIEPSQLLALEAARRALEDAGYADGTADHGRTAVVFGAEAGSDLSNAGVLRTTLPAYVGKLPPELDEQLPMLTEDSFPGVLANVIAGRVANRLNLGGANFTVDAACASSLAAVDVACKELTTGTSDLVLCGGVDLHNGINDYLLFSSVHALSPTGRSRTFDAAADGIALGEGVACVVLRRLADAERDGDRIYAVIKGVGSASDGRALGLTAPRPEGQRRALERAYRNARISPADVGLVEAHGTGTVVGDRTELSVLTDVFTEAGAAPGSCALGSVKSQIGHTKCAAGLAGLIKATMALHTGVRPPTIHLEQPNPAWDPQRSPFAFYTAARAWAAPPAERVAGVSAFGFGGTNFHVVLHAHDRNPDVRHGYATWPAELFCFAGADRPAAYREIERLLALAEAGGGTWRLRDLAAAASVRFDARDEPAQVAVVAAGVEELIGLLRRALAGEHDPTSGLHQPDPARRSVGGKIAFLFPGQGSQRPGMLADLFVAFPEVQHYLRVGRRWADLLYPPVAFDDAAAREQEDRVRDTRVAQPVLGVTGLAVDHLLRRLGVRPDMVAGHSYGELVALSTAGAFDAGTLLSLSAARATAILSAAGQDPGAMAAVAGSGDDVARALAASGLADRVVVANLNSPRQVVVSGPTVAVGEAVEALRGAGLAAKRIPVACAFHSPLVGGASATLASVLAEQPVGPLELPVWSNRTARAYGRGPDDVRAELAAQVAAPVRFVDQIEAMYAAGARVFVEAGPGSVLSALVDAILDDRPHETVRCDGRPGAGLRGFLGALAQLSVAGVRVRTGWLFDGRDVRHAAPEPSPGWTVDGHLVRTRDGACLPGGLAPARRISEVIVTRPGSYPADDPQSDHALLAEFLRTSREMIAAQRDVLLAYLAAGIGTPAAWQPPPAGIAPAASLLPAAPAAPLVPPVPAPVAEPLGPAPSAAEPTDIPATVQAIISERTGYPIDMIELDLDLEADLSIDSIKRAEIAGELAARLGNPEAGRVEDREIDGLARLRTARAISDWLAARLATSSLTPAATGPAPTEPGPVRPDAPAVLAGHGRGEGADAVPSAGVPPKRLVVRHTAAPDEAEEPATLAGARFVVMGGGELADAVTALLDEHDATVVPEADWVTDRGPVDGMIHLGGVAGDEPMLPEAFGDLQAALRHAPRWLIAAHPAEGGGGGDGLRGFFRTVAREYPAMAATAIGVDPVAPPDQIARQILAEILVADRHPAVVRVTGARHVFETVEAGLGALGSTGAGPAGDGTAEAQAIGLDADSVVVLFGGARGITARVARTLAAASRCRIELVGRTPLPVDAEQPAVAAAPDRTALRAALAAGGLRSPAEIEREAVRILAHREVRTTLADLRALGSPVRYHTLDVRDAVAVRGLLKEICAEHGRVDGLVHAAGVIEDRLLAEKDPDSFRRVFGTKVDGARAVLAAADVLSVRPAFTVLFGSISAVLGNRGQADYAAANDALETIGQRWAARTGLRCLTVHWGPWAPSDGVGGGMVTRELQQEYARRGISLIDPEEGALALLRELAWGDPATSAVVYTASGW